MHFDFQPVLHGKKLNLRPLRVEDFDALFEAASDPLIWEQHPAKNRHQEREFQQFFLAAMDSGGALVVIDNSNGRVIGSSRFYGFEAEKSEIEIGWTFLARRYWGGDFNRELKALMLRHALHFVEHVVFIVGPDNIRSQRAVEKIGAQRICDRPDAGGLLSRAYRVSRGDALPGL